jgi:hypothetical protein
VNPHATAHGNYINVSLSESKLAVNEILAGVGDFRQQFILRLIKSIIEGYQENHLIRALQGTNE